MRSASRWSPAVLLGATLVLTAWPHAAHAQSWRNRDRDRSDARLDTTFAFDRSGTVELTTTDGDIRVTSAPDNRVHVHTTGGRGGLRLSVSSSHVSLNAEGARKSDATFEVAVPAGVRVIAHSQSGDIGVHGTHGEVEAHSQSGDVDVADVATHFDAKTFSGDVTASGVNGDLAISTISGDLHLGDVRGNVEIGTVSGDVDLRGVTSRQASVHTTNGDVTYEGLIDPAGRYDFVSHSGDIRLHIQRDASAQLTVETFSGSINSDFPITLKPGEHGIGLATAKRFTFNIGAGGARLGADTFSGDITISGDGRGSR
jgi:DUF4097 and DUF4098 domain-containing protein YvlB